MSSNSVDFSKELELLVDRLRSMSLVRLAAALPPYESRADAVRALIADLATESLRCEELGERSVPVLGDESVGDQLAVIGHDFVAVCDDDGVMLAFQSRMKDLRINL